MIREHETEWPTFLYHMSKCSPPCPTGWLPTIRTVTQGTTPPPPPHTLFYKHIVPPGEKAYFSFSLPNKRIVGENLTRLISRLRLKFPGGARWIALPLSKCFVSLRLDGSCLLEDYLMRKFLIKDKHYRISGNFQHLKIFVMEKFDTWVEIFGKVNHLRIFFAAENLRVRKLLAEKCRNERKYCTSLNTCPGITGISFSTFWNWCWNEADFSSSSCSVY